MQESILAKPALAAAAERLLSRRVKRGDLSIRLGSGPVKSFGDGSGPRVEVHADRGAVLRMAARPSSLTLGDVLHGRVAADRGGRDLRFRRPVRPQRQVRADQGHEIETAVAGVCASTTPPPPARRNASQHYDLSLELYRRFLDTDLQYSCAYFTRPDMSLEEAQAAKRARIAAKLRLRPGDRVLDIGCGWGGLAIDLAGRAPVQVLGITLAAKQQATARESGPGLADWLSACALSCRTIARWRAGSTASSPSA